MDNPSPPTGGVEVKDWERLGPIDLLNLAELRDGSEPGPEAAARALRYARSGPSRSYDEIGFRFVAATPRGAQTAVTLQTIPGMRVQKEREERALLPPEVQELLDQQHLLLHRPLDLPVDGEGRYRYVLEDKPSSAALLRFTRVRTGPDGRQEEDQWPFALSAPPAAILGSAADGDTARILAQEYRVDLPGMFWLPASALVEAGRFQRMQECAGRLVRDTRPGYFYGFVSHRWLSRAHPDPEGVHARHCAWQLFARLCEAVVVAKTRGLHAPRKFSPQLGFPVGLAGGELAESLLVNVLRSNLDGDTLGRAAGEAAGVRELTRDHGVATAAGGAAGLDRRAAALAGRPVLRGLMERIHLWLDYSCLPQPPRNDREEELFRQGLEHLNGFQILGQTLVLLDDAEDYLSRAWCTLEAVTADAAGTVHPLPGSGRATARRGAVEHYFEAVLEDRPHLLWRALLDTEVFRVQDQAECLARLNLAATEARDLPFIYRKLSAPGATRKIHVDGSELLTGVFPLPAVGEGAVLWANDTGHRDLPGESRLAPRSLDWTAACRLESARDTGSGEGGRPPLTSLSPDAAPPATRQAPPCHVAVVGACEGEAVLLAGWALKYRGDLEVLLGVRVASVSWLATDIAPVGHFVQGDLRAAPVDAAAWVVVAISTRFDHCTTTSFLRDLLLRAGRRTVLLSVDGEKDNVCELRPDGGRPQQPPGGGQFFEIPLAGRTFPTHPGGLFRSALVRHLV
jgi:hypothetical protein